MRSFIAIELSEELKETLHRIQEKLKSSGADVKWVEPKNIHLTLKFLGEINDKELPKIICALQDIARHSKGFLLRFSSLGAFPTISFPRIIWAGIDKGESETKILANQVEERLIKIGLPKEKRPFSSHITIGRTRSNLGRDKLVAGLNSLMNGFKGLPQELLVNKITLFKSTLTPQGPLYEALKEISLTTS